MKFSIKDLASLPLIALLAANAIPLAGVVFLGWDAFSILLLYWAENLVIGFYNVLKMAFVKVDHPREHLGKLLFIPFFCVHFGGFTAAHGLFILLIFKKESGELMSRPTWPCFFVFLQLLFNVIKHVFAIVPADMKYALLGLFVSHGISFIYNYFFKGEYERESINSLMGIPYTRVVILHLAVLVGGFLSMAMGEPAAILFVLVVLKTVLDVNFHLREHRKKVVSSGGVFR
jgi:hypothetical protein